MGQHPNLLALEETRWLEKFAVDLRSTYLLGRRNPVSQLASMGIDAASFYEAFGRAINDLILSHGRYDSEFARTNAGEGSPFVRYRSSADPKARWVDGTPEYSLHAYDLLELFPHARFIHMVRDVRLVAGSLMHFDEVGVSARGPEAAYAEWYRFARAALDAERAFGSGTVLRLLHADLVSDPERALRRCLAFLGETFSADCLEPLAHLINTSGPSSEATVPEHDQFSIIAKAIGLSDRLLAEGEPDYEPDAGMRGDLGARSSLAVTAYSLPLEGPIRQQGPAAGFCDDFWIAGSLTATFVAGQEIRKVTVEGSLPSPGDPGDVTLALALNGDHFRQSFRPGQEISWTVPAGIRPQQSAELVLTSSRTSCPKREGLSDDERELVLFLRRLIFSP